MLKQILVVVTGIILFVSCCPPNISCGTLISQLHSCMIKDGSSKPSETIRIAMFINYHPAYGSWVSKIIAMDFEDVKGLPIETNNPAFGEGFVEATILWVSYGMDGWTIRLVMRYDLSVDNETANEYASMISDEIMRIIDKANTSIYWRNTRIDNESNTLVVAIDRGLLPRTLSSLEGLLKYRPRDGFASLISDNLLSKYIPGEIHEIGPLLELGLSDLKYVLEKKNGKCYWNFRIQFNVRIALGDEQWVEALDLNSLLFNDELISPSSQRSSEIIVEMPKRHSTPSGTYEVSIETVHPDGVVEEYDGWIRVVYQVTAPIDNAVAAIKVNRIEAINWYGRFIIIGLIVVALVLVVILIEKKAKGGEKQVEENVTNRHDADSHHYLP